MTITEEFPLIISPNLGCPQIISLTEGNNGEPISVIVASMDARLVKSTNWSLIPSTSNQYEGLNQIPLVQEDVLEIPQTSDLPSSVDETKEIVSQELLINVLGGGAHIFKIKLSISEPDPSKLLRKVGDGLKPTLYDLCLEERVFQRKLHAVCLVESKDNDLRFIHLTDLHLSRRNDLINDEVSSAVGPIHGFNNFNEKMRKFIKDANELADKGELDIVLLGGDLVDFVNHGISDGVVENDNNWQVFIEIMTGRGHEPRRENSGIRVPIFTSTGNHDWRLHPYDIANAASTFGIDKAQAEKFDFEYYDSMEKLNAKKEDIYEKIIKKGSPISKENVLHASLKWVLSYSETWQARALVPIVSWILSTLFPVIQTFSLWSGIICLIIATLLHYIINLLLARKVRDMVTHAVIPLEAGVHALHYYFLHVNPYFNYAFSFGSNYFIMMDTGPDCFIGQYFWDEGNKKRGRMSVRDNILGGSPDSMAFYPANEYYSYGQIIWLERVLKAIELESKKTRRIFICLHAPPINVENIPAIPPNSNEVFLEKGRIDIRYGTINHFLSQFFHLCLGRKENKPGDYVPIVDMVFSGHAHQKVEFRIAWNQHPLIYYGKYSNTITASNFNNKRPFIVQTAACGPLNTNYSSPPYFRTVHVDRNGDVLKFG
ncbi:MAG: metallophosphoesterase [Planctomycetes bacterium]|nr:metallophosphoesterase [Planctomycetota bacterium]